MNEFNGRRLGAKEKRDQIVTAEHREYDTALPRFAALARTIPGDPGIERQEWVVSN